VLDANWRHARVELRFFGGLTVEETAGVLKVSPQTVMRDWKLARAWLSRELHRDRADENDEGLIIISLTPVRRDLGRFPNASSLPHRLQRGGHAARSGT